MTINRRGFLGSILAVGTTAVAGCLGTSGDDSNSSTPPGEIVLEKRIERDRSWDLELSEGTYLHVWIDTESDEEITYERRAPDGTRYDAVVPAQTVEDRWFITETGEHELTIDTDSETDIQLSVAQEE